MGKNIGDLRRPNPNWRLGRAARWWADVLGLPADAVCEGAAQHTDPRPQYWYNIALGRTGYFLSATANVDNRRIGIRVYLMNRFGGETALAQLMESRNEIERELGQQLVWNPNPEASDKVGLLRREADIRLKDRWAEYLQWMVQATVNMRRVFGPRVRSLQVEAVSPASPPTEPAGA